MKKRVLRRGPARLATVAPVFSLPFWETALKITPARKPARILVGMQVIKVKNGLIERRVAPKGLAPKHCIKLVIPKIPPKIAPDKGPDVAAPITTGTIIKVISRPAVLR